MSKAKYEALAPSMRGETVLIDSRTVFLRTFEASAGCTVVNVNVAGSSLSNVRERASLRRLARRLLELVDEHS